MKRRLGDDAAMAVDVGGAPPFHGSVLALLSSACAPAIPQSAGGAWREPGALGWGPAPAVSPFSGSSSARVPAPLASSPAAANPTDAPDVRRAHEESAGSSRDGALRADSAEGSENRSCPREGPPARIPAAALKLRAAARLQSLGAAPPVPPCPVADPLLPSAEAPLRKRVRIIQPISSAWIVEALPGGGGSASACAAERSPAGSGVLTGGPGAPSGLALAASAASATAVPTAAEAGASPFLTSALPQSLLVGFFAAPCNDGTWLRSSNRADPSTGTHAASGSSPALSLCNLAPDLLPRRYSSCPSLPGGDSAATSNPLQWPAAAEPGSCPLSLLLALPTAALQPLAGSSAAAQLAAGPSYAAGGASTGVELSPHPAAPAPHAPDRSFFLRHAEWQVKRVERLAAAARAAAAANTGGGALAGSAVPLITQAAATAAAEGAKSESVAVMKAFETALGIMDFCHSLERRRCVRGAAACAGAAGF